MVRFILITIFSMLMFAGCNSEQAKLSPISKINADFTTGTSTSFPGGLIVVGVRQDANEKVSFAFPDGNPTPIVMERGDWVFYSFGYSGAETPADLNSGKFAGLTECGLTSVNIRGGERKAINLNLKPDGCSGKLARETKPQFTYVDTCPAFSYFNNTVPYQFYPQAGANAFACWNMPEDQNSNINYYKIFAMNLNNGVATESFSSPCLDEVHLGVYPRKIPTDVVPLKLKIYRSKASCEGDNIAHNTFYYPNGILSGNPANFDSLLGVNYTAGYNRLYVPEAHTQRYNSPFMNNIPRIMCDTPDCFVSPITDRTIAVEWDKPTKDQVIVPDINGNLSCNDLSHHSIFFGISDCKIKNNSLVATVSRNVLSCQDSGQAGVKYVDLYERNGFIYVLHENGPNSFVSILTAEGTIIKTLFLGANVDYSQVAATSSGDIYVSNPVTDLVTPFHKTGTASWSVQADLPITNASFIEISEEGRYLFYADFSSYGFSVYDLTTQSTITTVSVPEYVQKLQIVDGRLYVHVADAPSTSTFGIFRYQIVNGIPQYEANIAGGGGSYLSFHINKDLLNYLTPSYSVGTAKHYATASDYTGLNGGNAPSANFASAVNDLIVVNNTAYGIQRDQTGLYTQQWNGGIFVSHPLTASSCTDAFNVRLKGQVVATHKIVANEIADDTERSLRIFEVGDKLIGKKSADNKSYFQSLQEEQSRNTSGGALSLAQRLLGPHGVGGMLAEYADCNAVKTAATVMPIYKNVGVTDPYRGYQSFTVSVQSNADVIPKLTCNDGVANDATCTNTYDLKISVSSTGLLERENYQIKLFCTSVVGQIDYRSTNRDESLKQQLYWNTTLTTLSRVDNYKMFKSNSHNYFETSLIHSNGSFLRGRAARKDFWADFNSATLYDYQRDSASGNHFMRKIHLGGAGSTTPANYAIYRSETSYNGIAEYCLDFLEPNAGTTSVGICMFDDVLTDRVKQPGPGINPTVSLTSLENEFTFESLFNTFP